jgi:hypothetical protein
MPPCSFQSRVPKSQVQIGHTVHLSRHKKIPKKIKTVRRRSLNQMGGQGMLRDEPGWRGQRPPAADGAVKAESATGYRTRFGTGTERDTDQPVRELFGSTDNGGACKWGRVEHGPDQPEKKAGTVPSRCTGNAIGLMDQMAEGSDVPAGWMKHGPDSKVFRTRRAGPCRPTTGCLESTGVGLATMDHDAGCDKVWKARPGFGPEERQVAQAADRRQSGSERLPGFSTGNGVVGSATAPGWSLCG